MHNQMQMAEDYAKDLAKYYIAASRHLQSEQNAILRRFALTHHMTIKEAEELISSLKDPSSIKELIKALKKDPKNAELVREFEAHSARARIMRLNSLQSQVTYTTGQIQVLLNKKAQKLFVNLAKSAYYNTMFDAMQRAGYGFNVKMLDEKRIKRVMDRSWAGSGFSKRLWGNTKALEDAVKKEIMVNLLTGRPLIKASQAINEEFGKGYNNARRLIRTESAYITNQMTLEGYKDLEADKYIYVAILDLKTSEVCRSLDKKRFLVSSAKVGVNYPPMHPWCRSTTIPWMPDSLLKNMKQRALDPRTGKHVLVPGDMTYEQWYKQFVQGQPAGDPTTQQRNLTRDQYDRYKERLGDDFDYTYDEFIKMKSDKLTWAKWKRRYKAAGKPYTINSATASGGTAGDTTLTFSNGHSTFTSGAYAGLQPFKDVTDEWKAPKPWDKPIVTETDTYIAPDGTPYKVDGRNVQQEKRKSDEIEAAEIFSREKATEAIFQPKVNYPKEVRSPDIKTGDGIPYEIKTPHGDGDYAIKNCIAKAEGQSDKVIVNLMHSPLKREEIERQLSLLDSNPNLKFLKELVIIIDGKIDRVWRR